MKILVMGVSGTIGNAIYKCLSSRYEVYGTYNKNQPNNVKKGYCYKYDIVDYGALDNILEEIKPDLIISSLTGNFEHQLAAHKRVAEYLMESLGHCFVMQRSADTTASKAAGKLPKCRYETCS